MQRLLAFFLAVSSVLPLRADTVLVLPFFNHTKSADLDWIGESIAEAIRESLSSGGLLVLMREDALEGYRRLSLRPNAEITHASILKLGEALDATRVVYGRYELTPSGRTGAAGPASRGSIRIVARILNVRRLRQMPEYAQIGAFEDLGSLITRLGWQTLQYLDPQQAPSEEEFLKSRPPVRLDAMESYIRGLLSSNIEQQRRFFAQAARLDEHFSQPCYQLGKIYWEKKDYSSAAPWLERVQRSDSHYFEAQFYLGLCKYHTGDYTSAEKAFQTVASAVPLNEVFNDLGAAQSRRQEASAVESFRKAMEGDSSDPDYQFNVGYALWRQGQFAVAAERFEAALERSPEDVEARQFLDRARKQEGPKPGDPRGEGRERLKNNYEEMAYRQLKAELGSKK